jgi:hypothetical protein
MHCSATLAIFIYALFADHFYHFYIHPPSPPPPSPALTREQGSGGKFVSEGIPLWFRSTMSNETAPVPALSVSNDQTSAAALQDETHSTSTSNAGQISADDFSVDSHSPMSCSHAASLEDAPHISAGSRCSLLEDSVVDGSDVDDASEWYAFPQSESYPCPAANQRDASHITLHFVFGHNPDHSMVPDARLKLFNFIKHALYVPYVGCDRAAFSFWCPRALRPLHGASVQHLEVPNFADFGRHSVVHSFLDDVFSCAIEMHSTDLLHTSNFAYHVFHSFEAVTTSLGSIENVQYHSRSAQRWIMPRNINSVYFHKSGRRGMRESAELYCATAMQSRGGSTRHAVVVMGGDLSSVFVIKSAIEKGVPIFVIQQTGKLADCIADVKSVQSSSMQRQDVLATLLFTLKYCSCNDSVGDSDDSWLHVSFIHRPAIIHLMYIYSHFH